jgi:hypothetical protein
LNYKLINVNQNAVEVSIGGRVNKTRLLPGEENALFLGPLKDEQVVAYKEMARVGILLRPILKQKKVEKQEKIDLGKKGLEPQEDKKPENDKEPEPTKAQVRDEVLAGRSLDELEDKELKDLFDLLELEVKGKFTKTKAIKAIQEV